MGRNRSLPLREDWEEIKVDVMRRALWAKVMQHADVRETLLSTGDAVIIEHTKNDNIWADGGDGSGENLLGRLWMEIRTELIKKGAFNELANPKLPPWLKHPEIPQESIGWRMGYGEDYMTEWTIWFRGLSVTDKQKYQELYPTPDDWHYFYPK